MFIDLNKLGRTRGFNIKQLYITMLQLYKNVYHILKKWVSYLMLYSLCNMIKLNWYNLMKYSLCNATACRG